MSTTVRQEPSRPPLEHGGRCPLKLDWFAGRGVEPDADEPPRVVGNLRGRNGEVLSDHDPIVLDFPPRNIV